MIWYTYQMETLVARLVNKDVSSLQEIGKLLRELDALKGDGASFDWSTGAGLPPLLETLLRALVDSPDSLDPVADLVETHARPR